MFIDLLDSSGTGQDPTAGSCKHVNQYPDSITDEDFHDQL
jgi:hypothetical protein